MLQTIWNYLIYNYKKPEILYFTIIVLLFSEWSIIFFTFLDICKFDSLKKYRITYNNNIRPYPTKSEINYALNQYYIILSILLSITYFGMLFLEYIKWIPYDMSDKLPSFYMGTLHYIGISLFSELLFYMFHRTVHHPKLYWLHSHHHNYKYNSFSIVNHFLHPLEIIIFIIPPALPPIIFGTHLMIVWIYVLVTNTLGIYNHSGYNFPLLNNILLFNSRDHDTHHVKPKKNFSTGLFNSFIDRLFGTYVYEE